MKVNHEEWAELWYQAIKNMPEKKKGRTNGKFGTLARLLGYPLYSQGGRFIDRSQYTEADKYYKRAEDGRYGYYTRKAYSAHNRIYKNWQRGSRPKSEKMQHLLHWYALPGGPTHAYVALQRLGIEDQYHKPTYGVKS